MTQYNIYYLVSRLYSELENGDVEIILKKLRNCQGQFDGCDVITLDYRQQLIPSLIHEYCHKWYPKLSETAILKMEGEVINNLSPLQVTRIIKLFAEHLI